LKSGYPGPADGVRLKRSRLSLLTFFDFLKKTLPLKQIASCYYNRLGYPHSASCAPYACTPLVSNWYPRKVVAELSRLGGVGRGAD
jgi:hypothetical protein